MATQTNASKTVTPDGWFLNEPFSQAMVYRQLTNMKYTHVLGLDIGHGESVAYLSALKAVKKPEGQKDAKTVIEMEIKKVPVNKEGDSRIATMIGFTKGKAIIGSKACKAPEFYQHFKVIPALWEKNYRTRTFGQLMKAFIHELWNGIIRFNPALEKMAKEGKLLIAVGCPSSLDWTNAKAVEDYKALIAEATGCTEVTVLAESTAAIMSAVLDVNEINGAAAQQGLNEKKKIRLNRGLAVIDAGSSTVDFTYVLLGRKLIVRSLPVAGQCLDEQILAVALEAAQKESGMTRDQIPEEQINDIMIQIRQIKEDFYPEQLSLGVKPIPIWGCNQQGETDKDVDSGKTLKILANKEYMDMALNREEIQQDPFKPAMSWVMQLRNFVRDCRALIGYDENNQLLCDKVVLTGGTSNVQALQDIIKEEYPECEILDSRDCSASVAKGLCFSKSLEIKGGSNVETYKKDSDQLADSSYDSFISELSRYMAGEVCKDIQYVVTQFNASEKKVTAGKLLDEINKQVQQNGRLKGDACKEMVKELFAGNIQKSQAKIYENVNMVSGEIYGTNMTAIPEVPRMTAEELKKMTDQLDIAGAINDAWLKTVVAGINFSAISGILWFLTVATLECLPVSLAFAALAVIIDSEKGRQKIMQFILKNKTGVPRWILRRIVESMTDPKQYAKQEKESAYKIAAKMKEQGVVKNEFTGCVSQQAEMALGKVLFLVYDECPVTQ